MDKKDFKLLLTKVPSWQEKYMTSLCEEYIELLSNKNISNGQKLNDLYYRLKEDRRTPGVIITPDINTIVFDLIWFLNNGVITLDDIDDLSDELKEQVKRNMAL